MELTVAFIAGAFAAISALFAYKAQVSAAKTQRDAQLLQLAAQQSHERRGPFLTAQMKFYIEAIETVTKIPRAAEASVRDPLVQRFWQLYWGPLALVEDDEVARAMVAFGQLLRENSGDAEGLEWLSLKIAHACRNSLKQLWVPELEDITNPRASDAEQIVGPERGSRVS
jgi:hypothetical protein